MEFAIDDDKLTNVVEIVNDEIDPRATKALIKDHICSDWPNAVEHQEWLDTATPHEIVDWVASTAYGN